MLCCGRTDIGKRRSVNQDSFMCESFDNGMLLAVVCDGMGGAAGGGIASGLACGTFTDQLSDFAVSFGNREILNRTDERKIKNALLDAVSAANKIVFERALADESLRGMGTTLVATVAFCNTLFTVNVGDSRMYLIMDGNPKQITHDHSYVQYLVDIGKMTPEEAKMSLNRNIITKAIGTDREVEPDIFVSRLHEPTGISSRVAVLCSDGLTNHVSPDELAMAVRGAEQLESDRQLGRKAEELIGMANAAGGYDNITAVLITV